MGVYVAYYIVITICFIILSQGVFCYGNNNPYKTKIMRCQAQTFFLVNIACGLLILIIGLRSGHNGLDLYNSSGTGYFYYYDKINEDSVLEIIGNFGKRKYANFEIGFTLFCKFLGSICHNKQILLIGCSVMAVVPVGYFIYKNSRNIWLSIMIYMAMPFFGTVNFSAIRQGIAIGLIILSFEFIREKRKFAFLITVIIACTFHSTAIVGLVAYPAYYFRISRKSAVYGGVGMLIAIYVLKEPLFYLLARLLAENPEIVKSHTVNLFLILTMIYVMIVLFYKEDDIETRGFTNIFWMACATQAFAGVNNLAGRVTWYFMSVLIVLLPNFLLNMNVKEKQGLKYCAGLVGILACAMGLYFLRTDMVAMAYPYKPFWILD